MTYQTRQTRTYEVNGIQFGAQRGGLRDRIEQARARADVVNRFNQYMATVQQQDTHVNEGTFGKMDYGLMSRLQQARAQETRRDNGIVAYVSRAADYVLRCITPQKTAYAHARA